MRANDPNLPYLRRIAGSLVTDPLADSVRATRDVDAVVNADRTMFHRIEKKVAGRGFMRDTSSDVICRWVHKESGVLFDLMPVQHDVLGFSNRWYPYAVQTAVAVDLGDGLKIRLVSAVAFVATKLEAFASRGGGDFLCSHDLEDVLNIVDGRAELAEEMVAAPTELRQVVATAFAGLLANQDFANVLPGLIAEPERAGVVLDRLKNLSS